MKAYRALALIEFVAIVILSALLLRKEAVPFEDSPKHEQSATLRTPEQRQSGVGVTVSNSTILGNEQLEDTLMPWLKRVESLSSYLGANTDKRIPEMDLLTAADWLDATKETVLETDADYRKALAKLREIARRRTAATISNALQRVLQEPSTNWPRTPSQWKAYLPQNFNSAILERYEFNANGKIDGLRGDDKVVLVEKPVDELWDKTIFHLDDGGWGVREPAWKSARGYEVALEAFLKANQNRAPTSADELVAYVKDPELDQDVLRRIFNAYDRKIAR